MLFSRLRGLRARRLLLLSLLLLAGWEAGSGQLHYSVPEEAKHGTFVGRIAQDLGLELAELVPRLFRVASKDRGDLLEVNLQNALQPLDHEELELLQFQVSARDAGVPALGSNATLQVFVLDENDNAPALLGPQAGSAVSELVSRTVGAGHVVTKVRAVDADSGYNAWLSYELQPQTGGVRSPFRVGLYTGEISTTRALDETDAPRQRLLVLVKDHGEPALTSTATVLVSLVESGPIQKASLPVLTGAVGSQASLLTVNVYLIVAICAVSSLLVLTLLLYTALRCSAAPTEGACAPGKPVLVCSSAVGSWSYSQQRRQRVCSGEGPPKTDLMAFSPGLSPGLNISERSDHPEVNSDLSGWEAGSGQLHYSVPEEAKHGTFVGRIAQDLGLELAELVPRLFRVASKDRGDLLEHAESGRVFALQPLDHEELELLQFQVSARDAGVPALGSNATLQVFVLDENDNAPALLGPQAGSAVSELVSRTVAVGHVVTKVRAVDADSGYNAWLSYELQPQTGGVRSPFRVGLYTGEISTTRALDEADAARQRLIVLVKDHGEPSLTATVTVLVSLVENNQAPKASSRALVDAAGQKASLVTVNVYLIVAICAVSSLLVLMLLLYTALRCSAAPTEGACGPGKPVLVCSSAVGSWSYSQQRRQRVCSGEGPPKTDLMAFSPSLSQGPESAEERQPPLEPEYLGKVTHTKAGYQVCKISESHTLLPDKLPWVSQSEVHFPCLTWEAGSGQLHYSVPEEAKHGTFVGRIAQDLGLELAELVPRLFRVASKDRGDLLEAGSAVSELVSRTVAAGHVVTKVRAVDADSGYNAWLSYELQSAAGSGRLPFRVGLYTGEISTSRALDETDAPRQRLLVLVKDHGEPALTATATVLVSLVESGHTPKAPSRALVDSAHREASLVDVNVYLIVAICAVSSLLVLTLLLYLALRCSTTPTEGACGSGKPVLVCSSAVGSWSYSQQRRQRVCSGEGPPKTDLMAFSPSLPPCPVNQDKEDKLVADIDFSVKIQNQYCKLKDEQNVIANNNPPFDVSQGICHCNLHPIAAYLQTWEAGSGQLHYSVPEEAKHGTFVGRIAQDLGLELAELVPRLFRVASKDRGDLLERGSPGFRRLLISFVLLAAWEAGSGQLHYSVPEEAKHGTFVGRIAQDLGLELAELVPRLFRVASKDRGDLLERVGERWLSSYVSVHAESGRVFALQPLDHEELELLQFQVSARDAGVPALGSNATLQVFVLDENDNAPALLGPQGGGTIELLSRSVSPGHVVAKVRAVDADSGYNAWLSYELQPAAGAARSPFRVGLYTGEISTARALDEADAPRQRLLVLVKDHGEPALTATATFLVSLVENGQTPKLSSRVLVGTSGSESTLVTVNVYLIVAICAVSSLLVLTLLLYTALRCSAAPVQGACRLAKPVLVCSSEVGTWSYSQQRRQRVCSGEGPPKTDLMAFSPSLPQGPSSAENVNNLVVSSIWPTKGVSGQRGWLLHKAGNLRWSAGSAVSELVSRTVGAGHVVTKVRAVDADSGYNAWLSYELHPLAGGTRSLFRVGLYTGEISTTRALDESDAPRQRLLVLVKDHGEPVLTSTATVLVSLVESSQAPKTSSHASGRAPLPEASLVTVNVYLIVAICAVSSLLVLTLLLYTALRCSATPTEGACAPGKPVLVCSSAVGSWSYSQQRRQRVCSGEGPPKTDLMAFSPSIPPRPPSEDIGEGQDLNVDHGFQRKVVFYLNNDKIQRMKGKTCKVNVYSPNMYLLFGPHDVALGRLIGSDSGLVQTFFLQEKRHSFLFHSDERW
nr:uncharacterized protein LOC110562696 [Meriones unguiculatus]